MSLFLDGNDYALFSSPHLKEWTHLCDINLPDTGECPDIFELSVDGNSANTRWIFWGGNGNYYIGSFDGHEFQPESDVLRVDLGANFYAAQTWSDIPSSDGRRLQIAWMSGGKYPDMPFNQQMSIPCELTLRTTPEGIRMYRQPVKEIESLHRKEFSWNSHALKSGENLLSGISGDLFDIRAEIALGNVSEVGLIVRGEKIKYSASENQLSFLDRSAHLEPIQNMIRLQVLLDRTSIEVFGNDGRVSMSSCFLPDPQDTGLSTYSLGGEATIASMNIYEMCSAWL
jgi:fructan beta-fructosidase